MDELMEPVHKTGSYVLIGDLCVDIFMQVAAYPAVGGDGTVQAMHQHAGGSAANTAMMLAKLGGGPTDIQVRIIEDSALGAFLVLHLIVDIALFDLGGAIEKRGDILFNHSGFFI